MAMSMPIIRIIAKSCITRYDQGEREMIDIVNSYSLSAEVANLVKAEISKKRVEITFPE